MRQFHKLATFRGEQRGTFRCSGWPVGVCVALACSWLLAGAAWLGNRTNGMLAAQVILRRPLAPLAGNASDVVRDSESGHQLCVVVRTMPSQRFALPALLLSLFSDDPTRRAVRAVVVNTGTLRDTDLASIVSAINAVIGFEGVVASRRQQADIAAIFPKLQTPDFGYLLTDAVLEDVIAASYANSPLNQGKHSGDAGRANVDAAGKNSAHRQDTPFKPAGRSTAHVIPPNFQLARDGWTCEFVMATNGDNVYAAEFIRAVHDALAYPGKVPAATAAAVGSSVSQSVASALLE